jgi:hypothetical protein
MSQQLKPVMRQEVLRYAAHLSSDRSDSQAIAGRAGRLVDWLAAADSPDGVAARFAALRQRDVDHDVDRKWVPDDDAEAFIAGAEAYLPVLEGAA